MTAQAANTFQMANVAAPEPEELPPQNAETPAEGHTPEGHSGEGHDGMARDGHDMAPAGDHAGGHTDGLTETVGHGKGDHGSKAGLPQLDITTFASQIFWLVISFAVLYFIIARIAAPKIGGVIEEREARIKGDLDAATDAKKASEAAIAGFEKALADARGRAAKLSEEIRGKVVAEANARTDAAEKQLAADMHRAEGRISEMRAGALARLSTIARDTAADIVQKLTGDNAPAAELDAAVTAALKKS
jgi:F-type H+-transporting ATPase subunit b